MSDTIPKSSSRNDSFTNQHRSGKSAGVILIDPWAFNYMDPASYHVMVVQQKGSGVWGLPKGHLEEGETLYEAALREMREETGIHLIGSKAESDDASALREHIDYIQVPMKVISVALPNLSTNNDNESQSEPESANITCNLYPNHTQIKKIHFFAFVLLRSGQSLVPAPVDSHEIVRVSWLNVSRWEVDAVVHQHYHAGGHSPAFSKFNRTLSDGATVTLQEVCRKTARLFALKYPTALQNQPGSNNSVTEWQHRYDHLF